MEEARKSRREGREDEVRWKMVSNSISGSGKTADPCSTMIFPARAGRWGRHQRRRLLKCMMLSWKFQPGHRTQNHSPGMCKGRAHIRTRWQAISRTRIDLDGTGHTKSNPVTSLASQHFMWLDFFGFRLPHQGQVLLYLLFLLPRMLFAPDTCR